MRKIFLKRILCLFNIEEILMNNSLQIRRRDIVLGLGAAGLSSIGAPAIAQQRTKIRVGYVDTLAVTGQLWTEVVGFKYKMSNLQAAIGCAQMARIDELVGDKRRIFQYYQHSLASLPLSMNPEPADCVNGYWMPTIVVDCCLQFDRAQLLAKFKAENIDARVFFWPLSMQPMFDEQRNNTVAFGIWPQAINLPSYHGLTSTNMDRICGVVRDFLT
jgi:dTDP-4-amino-4,6-dideoxygalactose transaminase